MKIWAIADLHLSFGVENKAMDIFGEQWKDHPKQIREHWEALIRPEDLVLIAGDISWAMTLDEVRADLEWIDALPGTKVMIKGNHDYWWSSMAKVNAVLPPSIKAIHNNALLINDVAIGGTRLWDCDTPENEKIYVRELGRLEMSLKAMQPAKRRIAMTHYPPIGFDLAPSRPSAIFERFGIDTVVFGHLHSLPQDKPLFGVARGVHYHLTAADFIYFKPIAL